MPDSSFARTIRPRAPRRRGAPRRAAGGLAATLALASVLALAACAAAESRTTEDDPTMIQEAANVLSAEEEAEGFTLLFDGESLDMWRGFQREDVPDGWSPSEGTLAFTPGFGGGDLITRETFTDFDLRLEWKIESGGNSGIFFGVTEDAERTYHAGPEMQILDDDAHADGSNALTSAGANYALHAPSADVVRPVGEWNEARIVRRGDRVEQWLNGVKIVEYELGSDAWKALVADSKFAEWPEYGTVRDGHIGLQDHGDPVWFRNIRIKRL